MMSQKKLELPLVKTKIAKNTLRHESKSIHDVEVLQKIADHENSVWERF